MPSSHLQWSPVRAGPIFNVFGSKRKASENDTSDSNMQNVDDGLTAKRRCLLDEPAPVELTLPQEPMESMELNHNDVHLPNHHLQRVEQMQQPRVPSPWPSEVMAQQNPSPGSALPTQFNMQLPHQPPQPQATGGIMELSDETFNMEAAQSIMDSDFIPDNQQYAADGNFCREFCGQGDQSPNTGRVRCYCKPSWEGMVDTAPYLSDVY